MNELQKTQCETMKWSVCASWNLSFFYFSFKGLILYTCVLMLIGPTKSLREQITHAMKVMLLQSLLMSIVREYLIISTGISQAQILLQIVVHNCRTLVCTRRHLPISANCHDVIEARSKSRTAKATKIRVSSFSCTGVTSWLFGSKGHLLWIQRPLLRD